MVRRAYEYSGSRGGDSDNSVGLLILAIFAIAIVLGFFILIMKTIIIAGLAVAVIGLLIAYYGYKTENLMDLVGGFIIVVIGLAVLFIGVEALNWAQNDPTGRQMMQWGSDIRNVSRDFYDNYLNSK